MLERPAPLAYSRPIASALCRRIASSSSFAIPDEVSLTRAAEVVATQCDSA
jgi:hypothetical protein